MKIEQTGKRVELLFGNREEAEDFAAHGLSVWRDTLPWLGLRLKTVLAKESSQPTVDVAAANMPRYQRRLASAYERERCLLAKVDMDLTEEAVNLGFMAILAAEHLQLQPEPIVTEVHDDQPQQQNPD